MTRFTWRKSLAFSAVAVALAFAIPEAALRLLRYQPITTPLMSAGAMPGSRQLLWELEPGVKIENGIAIHANSHGLRGPEVVTPKPAGVRRLLSLGDSSVFGFGVKDEESYTALTGQALAPRVEAINGGIPGFSTYQSLILLKERALALEPDLLVIGNLWSDNNFDAFVDKELLAMYAREQTAVESGLHRFLSQSRLFQMIEDTLRGGHTRRVGWMLGSHERSGQRRVEINDYAHNLEAMARMALEHHAEVMFLVLPNDEDLGARAGNDWPWVSYRKVMRDTARRFGSPVIESPDLFRKSGLKASDLFSDHMHPSPRGHRIIADALIDVLKKAGWPEGGSVMGAGDGSTVPHYDDRWVRFGWVVDTLRFFENLRLTLLDVVRQPAALPQYSSRAVNSPPVPGAPASQPVLRRGPPPR